MRTRIAPAAVLLLVAGTSCSREDRPVTPSPSAGTTSTPHPTPPRAEPTAEERAIEKTMSEALAWLVTNQNKDGSWGSHESPRPIEVLADVPGSHQAFQVATTALAVIALDGCPALSEEKVHAADRALDWLLDHFDVKRASGLEHYNVWSFGYGLQCFAERLIAQPQDPRAEKLRAACKRLVEKLGMYQTLDGGWGYLSLGDVPTFQPSETSMSFTTATIVVALERAKRAGIELPQKLVSRAIENLERNRLPDGAFLYGDYLKYRPRHGINQVKGSACRTPACQYALLLFGEKVTEEERIEGLEQLIFKQARFQKMAVRRPIPHESWYSVSGYFYLYGHAYATYILEALPKEKQARYWPALVEAANYCREPDGSYWDYPLYSYHKPYGTAYALMVLSGAMKALALPAR
jgi:squalene cyclase